MHLRARGRVQGVNFRFAAADVARRLRVTGRIRNTEDGQVEAIAEGDEDAVARFVAWCRRGPPAARVEDVAVRELDEARRFDDFRVAYEPLDR